jgi:hypothetical protein
MARNAPWQCNSPFGSMGQQLRRMCERPWQQLRLQSVAQDRPDREHFWLQSPTAQAASAHGEEHPENRSP